MKKIQITQDLFVKMIKYFYGDEFEVGDDELFEIYRDIKRALTKSLMLFQDGVITLNIKQWIATRQRSKQGRNILMQWACIRISDVDFTLIVQTGMWHIPVKIIKNERIE